MKRLLLALAFIGTFMYSTQAQYAQRDWVLGVSSAFVDYYAFDDQGWFNPANWNNFIGPTNVHLSKSLCNSANIAAQVTYGDIDKFVTPIHYKAFTDFGLDVQYKFANGYILDQTSWFDPYVQVGGGLMRINRENYPMIDAGIGSNFWISDRFGFNIQTGINLPFDFDKYQKHSIGFVFNLGEISDRDGDGVVDKIDACPDEPGDASNKGCPVVKKEDKAMIQDIAKRIYFETDSDVLKPESKKDLDMLSDILKRNPQANLDVEGHTDNTGSAEHNLDLSTRRAAAVVKYLVDKGIDATRLASHGYGETMPVATNDTPEGRALNRRVELKVK